MGRSILWFLLSSSSFAHVAFSGRGLLSRIIRAGEDVGPALGVDRRGRSCGLNGFSTLISDWGSEWSEGYSFIFGAISIVGGARQRSRLSRRYHGVCVGGV